MTFSKGLILAAAFLCGGNAMAVAIDLREGRRISLACLFAAVWCGAMATLLSL